MAWPPTVLVYELFIKGTVFAELLTSCDSLLQTEISYTFKDEYL
jgi:hypothetical protein